MYVIEPFGKFLARHARTQKVHENKVVVRTARNHIYTARAESFRKFFAIQYYLMLIRLELRRKRFLERHCFCRDNMH